MSETTLEDGWELPIEIEDADWLAARRLAQAVRALACLAVETEADAGALDVITARVRDATAVLRAHPAKTPRDAFADGTMAAAPDRYRDKGAMLGHSNPLAGPLVLRREGQRIVGEGTFGSVHGGAPGFLHGGLVATVLDEVLGHVAIASGAMVVTARMTVRYVRPTPLYRPLRAEAWLVAHEGRRYTTAGRILDGDRVTAEGEGVFVDVRGGRFAKLFDDTAR